MATAIKEVISPNKADVIVAADIGYGSTKAMASVKGAKGDVLWMPSGAAPASRVNTNFAGCRGVPLNVKGTPYFAGFEPDESRHRRHDGELFAKSDDYFALYLETLERLGHQHISKMVLGLPSREFDSSAKPYLKDEFAGTFSGREKDYTVDEVFVADQPIGTAASYYQDHTDLLANRRLLIIDIGYGTTDVALIVRGGVDRDYSMSIDTAMRTVCEQTARSISQDNDFDVRASEIDETFRSGSYDYVKWGKTIDLKEASAKACESAASNIVNDIIGKFGSLASIDQILTTGGGSVLVGGLLDDRTGGVPTASMENPVEANLEGFLLMVNAHV